MALTRPHAARTPALLRERDRPIGHELEAARDLRRLVAVRVVLDLLTVLLAMVAAFQLKSFLPGHDQLGAVRPHILVGAIAVPVWAVMLWRGRLYSEAHTASRLDGFRRLVRAALRSVGIIVIVAFLLRLNVSRSWLGLTAVLGIVLLAGERELVSRTVRAMRRRGRLLRNVVIVGGNLEALGLCAMLAEDPALGYRPVGIVDDDERLGSEVLGGFAVLGTVASTQEVARVARASAVIIATTAVDQETTNRLIRQLGGNGLRVELSSSLRDIAPTRLQLHPLGRAPMVYVEPVNRDGWEMRAKRTFDIVVAASLGALAAPFLAVIAVLIKLTSSGPVHFRQQRVGMNGEPFEVLKLRTMVVDAEAMKDGLRLRNEADGPLFKLRDDPRITSVGRALRALSIDELPQLWNVLRGDMSLVGPRPALPDEVRAWSPELHGRLAVKPGMTGMWQVSGGGRWHSFDEYARLDLYYVDNWSIWTDLAVLAKTVPAVLLRRGQA